MTGIIKLTLAGINTGPFNLYSNIDGYISAFAVNITRAQLLTGYPTDAIPSLTTIIRIMSIGDCTNYIDVPLPNCLLIGTGVITIPPPTTTTTTTLPLTTTTSTSTSTSTTTTTVIPTTTTTTSSSTSTTTSTTTVIPTTTSTTTINTIICYSYQSAPYDTTFSVTYIDCNGVQQTESDTCFSTICRYTICARNIISSTETMNIIGTCDATTTTTTTVAPTTTTTTTTPVVLDCTLAGTALEQ